MATKTKNRPEAEVPAKSEAAPAADAPSMDVSALLSSAQAKAGGRPAMTPPGEAALTEEEGITAWHNGKKVTATWSNAADKNAFAAVEGQGWRRIATANATSFLSLTMLSAHAEADERSCNIEIGSDNKINQIYVW